MIKVFIPWIGKTETIVITGDSERLGKWNPDKGIKMKRHGAFFFTSRLDFADNESWKLVLLGTDAVKWEDGENRLGMPDGITWFRGGRKATGMEIPIFSLRSPSDNGIGDFGSLESFIISEASKGNRIVQILPLDDTGGSSNPYEIISAFAINPIYLSLDRIGLLADIETAHAIADRSHELAYSPIVEWNEVAKIKWLYYQAIYAQDGETTCNSKEFLSFLEREKSWILPYSTFCYLKKNGNIRPYSRALIGRLMQEESSRHEILFYAFLQYHADIQLREVHRTAEKLGVVLSGDIPCSVIEDSADVWQNPGLFQMGFNEGTMPDAELSSGQKWETIPLNWNGKDIDKWWKNRLTKLSRYYDLCRLDNTIGYFRQWKIPKEYATGIRGRIGPCKCYTAEEIKAYGYNMGGTKDLEPLITKEYLQNVIDPEFKRFGEFFKRHLDGRFFFKPEMKKPAGIEKYLTSHNNKDEESLRRCLVKVQDECLFIKTPGGYQPRIAAQYTNAYSALDPTQKNIFNSIYDSFYYSSENRNLWEKTGIERLKILAALSPMALYADCRISDESIKATGVLSFALERHNETTGYMGVCMPYTRNMAPFREWWLALGAAERQRYWSEIMNWKDKASSKAIPAIYADIVRRMKRTDACVMITPFQDLCKTQTWYNGDKISQRINTPGESSTESCWSWRVPETF